MVSILVRLNPAIFCNLKKLWVKCDWQAEIHIPAAVRLASLQIYVHVLGLSFEDAVVSCADLMDVIVLHRKTTGPSVMDMLGGPMAEKGKRVHVLHHLLENRDELKLVTSAPPSLLRDKFVFAKHVDMFLQLHDLLGMHKAQY